MTRRHTAVTGAMTQKYQRKRPDPNRVRRAVASLNDHPMRDALGKLLAAIIERDAPRHLHLLPDDFVGRTPMLEAAE